MKTVIRSVAFSCAMLTVVGANADFSETTGEITLEAEDYQRNTPQGTETWAPACAFANPPTQSGDSAMLGTGSFHGNGDLANSPHLEFDVLFRTNGTYTVWIKGDDNAGNGDSVHVGLDGVRLGSAVDNSSVDFNQVTPDFAWSSWSDFARAGSAAEFTFQITDATPGGTLHTFDVWLRDTDVFIDKVFLTSLGTDPTVSEPTADDPAAGGGTLPTVAAPSFTPNGGFFDPSPVTQDVTIATCTTGATIHFTQADPATPPPDPTTSDPSPPVPLTLLTDSTVKAIAVKAGTHQDSAISSADFIQTAAPVAFNDAGTVNEGAASAPIDLAFNDTDAEDAPSGPVPVPPGAISITNLPSNGTVVDNGNGTVTYTHDGSETTSDFFRYRIIDSEGRPSANKGRVDVTVTPQNDAPTISGSPATSVDQDAAYSFTPAASDPDLPGDTLLFSIANKPAWASFSTSTGALTGTPTNADVGTTTGIVITVDDQKGQPNSTASLPPFNLTVNNINDAPTIGGTPATTVAQDVAYSFIPTASDPDAGDILLFSITNKPSWASFNTATGELSGTPTNADVGTTTGIVITVDDQQGQPNSVASLPTFDLAVTNVNDAPTIGGTPATSVAQDSPYSFIPTASDPDTGDTLLFSITNKPSWASFNTATGELSGTPTNADVGTTTGIVITVDDQQGQPNSTASLPSFDLMVVDNNDPPAFTSTAITGATTDVAYTYNITSSDPDAGDTLVVTATMLPAWLTLTDSGTGDGSATLTGTPTSAEIGDHSVVLVVTDSGSGMLTDTQSFTVTVAGPNVASVLPGSRAVPVGGMATAFVTMVNAGANPLTGCGIAPVTQVPAGFSYQTTDPVTNALTGTPDTPVDLAAGASQSFLITFTPTQAISATEISFDFSCDGAGQTAAIPGINTFLLSASSTPGPDVVAVAASNPPGQVVLSSAGAFAVATANVGATGPVTVSADTGAASLPVSITLCETNPATGACVNPATPTSAPINMTINAGATPTFGVFVSGDTPIPFDPAANRVFFRIQNGSGDLIASTSVAVSKP